MAFLKNIWKNNSKHKKLSEEMALQNIESDQLENDVIIFKLKYLGSTVVEKLTGESINTEAVKNILKASKVNRKKLQRVQIAISRKGIVVSDFQGNDILKVSIYRISNCSAYNSYRQIFSFISTDENETMECHGFVCGNRKMAETVTLTVAHTFSTAYEAWRVLPEIKQFEKNAQICNNIENNKQKLETVEKLIDFDGPDPCSGANLTPNGQINNLTWVSFEDDFVNENELMPNRMCHRNDLMLS